MAQTALLFDTPAQPAPEIEIIPMEEEGAKAVPQTVAPKSGIPQDRMPQQKLAEQREKIFRKGRPRSERSRSAILKATNNLLLHMSVQDLSIEGIAKKARVGKTTIYRWWPNKTAIVMDAIASQPGVDTPMATPKNNAEALSMQLDKLIRMLQSKNGETIAQLFSEAQRDHKAQEIFANTFLAPLIDAIEFSVEQGKDSGEFRKGLDTRMAVDMLCGPVFFRMMGHPADFNEDFQRRYPDEAVKLISV